MRTLLGTSAMLWLLAIASCGSSSPHGLSPDADCDRYLSCLTKATPMAFPAALAAYGNDSPCWKSVSGSQSCTAACKTSYAQLGQQCGCSTDADCTSTTYSFCDTSSMECVECTTSAQCAAKPGGLLPYCWSTPGYTSQCTDTCATDADCPSAMPVCRFVSHGRTACGQCDPFRASATFCAASETCANSGMCVAR